MKIKGENNMQDDSVKKSDIKIGEVVTILTKDGAIKGVLLMIAQYMDKNLNMKKMYRVMFNGGYIDILEDNIDAMRVIPSAEEDDRFLKSIEEKYNIQCIDTDEEGNSQIGDVSKIFNDVIDNGVWDKMDEYEKKNLLDILCVDSDTLVKLIDNYLKTIERNKALYNKMCELSNDKIRIYNSVIDFMKKYEEVSNFIPGCKWAFDLLFYDALHMDEFLKEL